MRVLALLSHYDEDPLALLQCVNDLAKIGVTDLIAVGGRYESFPEQPVLHSQMSEIDALASRCLFHDIDLTLEITKNAWHGDEVAKRQRMLELAHVIAGGEDAYICVWDADYRLFDDDCLPYFLAGSRSYDVLFSDDPREGDPPEASWYRMKMFMALEPGLRMGTNHHTYVYADGVEFQILPKDEEAPLSGFAVRHLKYRRGEHRLNAQAAWYSVRDSQGLES